MTPDIDRLLQEALRLPAEARAALAGSLIDSLDEAIDPDAEQAWAVEIEKRSGDLASGRVRPIPWSEARRRIAEG